MAAAAAIQWLASADKKQQAAFVSKDPATIKVDGGVLLKEPNAVARALAKAVHPALLGGGGVEQGQVAQWMAWAAASTPEAGFAELNEALAGRSFLAGQQVTLADVLAYLALAHGVDQTFPGPLGGLTHLLRWFNTVQHALRGPAFAAHDAALLPKPLPIHAIYKPISMPVFAKEGTAATAAGGASGAPKPAPAAQQQQQQQQQQGKGEGGQEDKKQQQKQPQAKEGGAKGGDGGKKAAVGGKKGGTAAAPAPPAAEEDLDNPNHLNIRVGKIVKAWPHPESDKLWCEEIDLGEAAPRQIASGLRQFYPQASDLEGRLVVVLANLKARKLAGFASNGMVLCASNAEHTEVKFVEVPAGAKVGDRIVFVGGEGKGVGAVVEAMEPNKLQKKKVFEKIAPGLATDAKGVCHYNGAPFTVEGSTEVCTAPLPNAHVS